MLNHAVEEDRALAEAQAIYLDRCAPGYRTRRIRWSGGATQVIEVGEGPPLLLVHGGLGEAFQWGPVLAPLARRFRVLAVDRPGHGLADPFDHRGVDLFALARRFLGEVLDALELPAAPIVANSMGGLWSIAFALEHPARVPRLVLPGSPAGFKRGLPLGLRLGAVPVLKSVVQALMRRPTREAVRDFAKAILVAHPERLGDDYLDVAVASQRRNAPSWFTLLERTVDIGGVKQDLVLGERWRDLAVPTTILWGDKDAFGTPEEGDAIARKNRRVRIIRIQDAGHAPWLDAPERIVEAIEAELEGA